jgi:hypothetical protein
MNDIGVDEVEIDKDNWIISIFINKFNSKFF